MLKVYKLLICWQMIIWRNVEATAVAMIQATSEATKTPTDSYVLEHSTTKQNTHNVYIPDILTKPHSSMNNISREWK